MKYAIVVFLGCALSTLSGCADLNSLSQSLFTDQREEAREFQSAFDRQKNAIEARASAGYITWAQAARNVRDLDRSWVGKTPTWKFDSDDEEYHAYSIALAERVDAKQLSFSQYDAMRTQRFSQITARRQQINSSQPRSSTSPTNCRSVRNLDGSFSTNCY